MNIDISKLDKAEVLKALYDNSKPLGMGFLQATPGPISLDEARSLLEESWYFDYLKGRVLKSDLGRDDYNPALYDRDNGDGAARRALQPLLDAVSA